MLQGFFLAGSAAFFTVYIIFAEAFGVLGESKIEKITAPEVSNRGGFNGFVDSIVSTGTFAIDLFARFIQLLTFQIPGQTDTSIITLVIFIPLGFVNGYIIFRAIRG